MGALPQARSGLGGLANEKATCRCFWAGHSAGSFVFVDLELAVHLLPIVLPA